MRKAAARRQQGSAPRPVDAGSRSTAVSGNGGAAGPTESSWARISNRQLSHRATEPPLWSARGRARRATLLRCTASGTTSSTSLAGLPRVGIRWAPRQAMPAITCAPSASWPVQGECPCRWGVIDCRPGRHRARITPRTRHRSGSLSHEQRLELRKSAEHVGQATQAVTDGLVRQREVGAGARLDTGEAAEDVPPRVP